MKRLSSPMKKLLPFFILIFAFCVNGQKTGESPLENLSKIRLTDAEKKVTKKQMEALNEAINGTNTVRVVKAKDGDTIATLAAREKASAVEIAKFNGLLPTSKLSAGREIKIPVSYANTYKIGAKPTQSSNGKVRAVLNFISTYFHDPYTVRFARWSKVEPKLYKNNLYWSVTVKLRAKNILGAYVLSESTYYIKSNKVVAVENLN